MGDVSATADAVTFTNQSTGPVTITSIALGGADANDFERDGHVCHHLGRRRVLRRWRSTSYPARSGCARPRSPRWPGRPAEPVIVLTGTGSEGYYEVTATGAVSRAYGDASHLGDLIRDTLWRRPIVASGRHRRRRWLLAGRLRRRASSPSATPRYFGSTGAIHLNKPIVGMAPYGDPMTGQVTGYWLVASDGGHLHLRRRRLLRLDRRHPSEQAHRGHGAHARRRGLLAGGRRRRHLQLRRRQLLRLDRRPST